VLEQRMSFHPAMPQRSAVKRGIAVLLGFLLFRALPALAVPQRPESLLDRLAELETDHGQLCDNADETTDPRTTVRALVGRLNPSDESLRDPAAEVEALNRLVFDSLGIRATQDLKDPCNLLPGRVLERKQGYCVGIAALYLVLAERLGLPIFAVATPSHVFLRYDDGASRINIETFQRGAHVADAHYVGEQRIPSESIRSGVFMRNLTQDEFLAQVHNNLGVIYSERTEYGKAAEQYGRAIDLHPGFPAAFYNHGNDLLARGEYRKALRRFSMALRLYPTDVWALNNRGLARTKMGRAGTARKDFEAALRIDAGFEAARANLARLREGRDQARDP
jgi:regulator of sirC expression with transglutaminase-like and TPR domain